MYSVLSRDSQERISSHVLGSLQNVYIDLFSFPSVFVLGCSVSEKVLSFFFSVARAKVALD